VFEVSLRNLPPHLRLLAWTTAANLAGHDSPEIHAPKELAGLPAFLVAQMSTVTVRFPAEHETNIPDTFIRRAGLPSARPLVDLALCLALWDEAVRTEGIYAGNVYLATEAAVARMLNIAGVDAELTLSERLDLLQAFEMLYRFPVAWRFRGKYGGERQCRINGWGRLLLREVRASNINLPLELWHSRMSSHLKEHGSAYRAVLSAAKEATDNSKTRIWDKALQLPVPLVI
jgi:hypothetical protein